MNSNDNMLSQDSILNTEVLNKGFAILDSLFKNNGWHMVKNEMNHICYTKFGNETDIFNIKIDNKSIQVSIPIKNSPFQYVTSFKDYFSATEYVESRFMDFISEKKLI
jgi:hypothetical protein